MIDRAQGRRKVWGLAIVRGFYLGPVLFCCASSPDYIIQPFGNRLLTNHNIWPN